MGDGVGAAVVTKNASSAVISASAPLVGRSMSRSCALRAFEGASIGPVVTGAKVPAGPATSSESSVASWLPPPSVEAYHAIRTHATSTPGPGRSLAPASYHCPGVTRTVW